MRDGLLLDTHALIWVVLGGPFEPQARARVNAAVVSRNLFVSAATAWELGTLVREPGLAALLGAASPTGSTTRSRSPARRRWRSMPISC